MSARLCGRNRSASGRGACVSKSVLIPWLIWTGCREGANSDGGCSGGLNHNAHPLAERPECSIDLIDPALVERIPKAPHGLFIGPELPRQSNVRDPGRNH